MSSSSSSGADGFAAALANEGDACIKGLESNFSALIAGVVLELLQWTWDFTSKFLNLFWILWTQTTFFGLWPWWWANVVGPYFHVDWSRTYQHGVLGDIQMARNNSRCASNIYVGISDVFKPDYKFAGDTEFYLNSVQAAQSFYLAFLDWGDNVGWLYTLWPLGPIIELIYNGAILAMVISSLLLYLDMTKLQLSPLTTADA